MEENASKGPSRVKPHCSFENLPRLHKVILPKIERTPLSFLPRTINSVYLQEKAKQQAEHEDLHRYESLKKSIIGNISELGTMRPRRRRGEWAWGSKLTE